jgi:stage II sporulation protein M
LPHGIFEIPAIVIACAAGLRAGAIVSKPPVELSVFEAWLMAIADLVKLMVALVIPLLFIGGIVEVTVTPRVIEWLLETL